MFEGLDTAAIIEELNNFYFLFFIFVMVMIFIALLLRQTRKALSNFLKSCGVGIRFELLFSSPALVIRSHFELLQTSAPSYQRIKEVYLILSFFFFFWNWTLSFFRRKGFHFSGLLIPGIYLFGLFYQFLTHKIASIIMGTLMFICLCAEVGRFKIPAFKRFMNDNFTAFMREEEKDKYSAILSYCIGVTFSIIVFSPLVAVAGL